MTDSLSISFNNRIFTPNVALQLKQYDALLDFPEHVVKRDPLDLKIVSTLEKQEFCEVLLVKSESQDKMLVMKRLDSEKIRSANDFLAGATDLATEARFLSKLNHENIIKLEGVSAIPFSESYGQNGCGHFFTMEYMGETLKDRLQIWRSDISCYLHEKERGNKNLTTMKRKLDQKNLIDRLDKAALGISDAMGYLQDRGIVLRDLTPEKIGYNPETGQVYLMDLSFARYFTSCKRDLEYRSAHYTAPEVRRGNGYSLESDVYSYGVILYEIVSLKREWRLQGSTTNEEGLSSSRPSLEDIMHEDIQRLIEECWSEDPKSRPSFEIISMTVSAIIAATRKKESLKTLRRPMVVKQAVFVSGSESHSTLSTVECLYDEEESESFESLHEDHDELAVLEC